MGSCMTWAVVMRMSNKDEANLILGPTTAKEFIMENKTIFIFSSMKTFRKCVGRHLWHAYCELCCAYLTKDVSTILVVLLPCCFLQLSCGGLKLIDVPKSAAVLKLTEQQKQIIQPKLQLIRDIVVDYNFEKKQLEVDYQVFRAGLTQRQFDRYQGGFPNMRSRRELNAFRDEARKFLRQRDMFLREIKQLIGEIAAGLTAEQRTKLTKLKMPELEIPMMLREDPYNDLRYIPNHPLGGLNLF